MDSYEVGDVLGRGAFGAAMKVVRKVDRREFAVKKVDISAMPESEQHETKMEVLVMRKLSALCDHPNIIAYFDSFFWQDESADDKKLCIVMEYADAGALSDRVRAAKEKGQPLSLDVITRLFTQLTMAVEAMHGVCGPGGPTPILHRDLKTQNVFLKHSDDGEGLLDVKLGDFGLSKPLRQDEMAKSIVGTPYNLSAELCQGLPYSTPTDIWALGCILYEMATARHAFEGSSLPALVGKIMRVMWTPVPERRYAAVEGGAAALGEEGDEAVARVGQIEEAVGRCLVLDPGARLGAAELLAQPLLSADHAREKWRYETGASARRELKQSFHAAGAGVAGGLAEAMGLSAAEEAEAEAAARVLADARHAAPDRPLCWGFGQAWPGALRSWWAAVACLGCATPAAPPRHLPRGVRASLLLVPARNY
jgi:serine/threonine protein kinase